MNEQRSTQTLRWTRQHLAKKKKKYHSGSWLAWAKAPELEWVLRWCSELLQELTEVGGLGQLPVDPGQLVEHGAVQRDAEHLALCTATTVPTDL